MVNIPLEVDGYRWSWDNYLYQEMHCIIERGIPNKWDCLGIIFGREGSGKTTLASQICKFMDPTFNLDRVVFTPEQFLQAIDGCQPEQAIQWDEAVTGATAQGQANEISQAIVSKLTTIRRKRLKIILCFPYLHMLNKYFISRCLFSIYVYANAFDDRGHALFYNRWKTDSLYGAMKIKYTYSPLRATREITSSFFFKYPNMLCVPEEPYEDKKERSTRVELGSKKDAKERQRLATLIRYLAKNKILCMKEIAPILGVHYETIRNIAGGTAETSEPD